MSNFFQPKGGINISKRKVKGAKKLEPRVVPWVEKYRPKNLNEVSAQDHAVQVLRKTILSENLPHMLFYGPPGTGKTSTILALTRELYGPELIKSRVLELNASDERGISIVREKVKNFAKLTVSKPTPEQKLKYSCPPYKIIILDEADSMTSDAQSALRRTIETYSNITRFCLVCNYITRIIDPLASRCSKFRFKKLDELNSLERLKFIANNENLSYNDNVLETILKVSNGDLRKAITYLQSAARLHLQKNPNTNEYDEDGDLIVKDVNIVDDKSTTITIESIQEIAGIIPDPIINQLYSLINSNQFENSNSISSLKISNNKLYLKLIQLIDNIVLSGWSGSQIINQIHDKLILNDEINSIDKNKISNILLITDKRLSDGSDEHIQLLNLFAQLTKILNK